MAQGTRPAKERSQSRPAVMMSANSFWNIANFRSGLVRALADEGYEIVIAAPGADAAWAGKHGAKAVEISVDRPGLNPLKDAKLLISYWRLFDRFGTEYFLGFTAKPNIYGALAARMSGVRSLANVSGLGTAFMSQGWLSRFVSFLYKLAFRKSEIVFFQNPDDRDLFVTQGIVRASQARVLPGSGVDLAHFSPRPGRGDGVLRFLFIGRLLADKGVRELVDAARLLKLEEPRWRFQLLGPIDEENRSGIKGKELQLWLDQGLVEHLGDVEDVRPHIAAASAVVLPSYREGLPRSLLEAAAMARPLIATNVPGNRQIVEHGVNGLLCDVRNAASLAAAMKQIGAMSEDERVDMGQAGRALVERAYSEDLVIDAYLDALAQLQSQT
jgi:glycosyltransferase involved in cell wall biosynthesis